jgi:DNA-binding NtrC family response regulator
MAGNVRELINPVRQAVVMTDGRYITAHDHHLTTATARPADARRGALPGRARRDRARAAAQCVPAVCGGQRPGMSRVTLPAHGPARLRNGDDLGAARID